MNKIEINEGQLSPFAPKAAADQLIEKLRGRGWLAVYAPAPEDGQLLAWQFTSRYQQWAFEKDFEDALDELLEDMAPAIKWRVDCPCSCGDDLRGKPCDCKPSADLVHQGRELLFEPAEKPEQGQVFCVQCDVSMDGIKVPVKGKGLALVTVYECHSCGWKIVTTPND